jgi:hypothetical protein
MAEGGNRLGVVVIDTFSTSIPGADENSAMDMSPVLTGLQALALDFGLLVIVVTHTGKDETRGVRGWSGLLANADGLVMLDKFEQGGPRTGTVVKVKNGEAGQRFAFSLRPVPLGADEDGDLISSCVVDYIDVPDVPKTGRPPTKAVASADTIMKALNRIWPTHAIPIAFEGAYRAKDGGEPKGVRVADLQAEAFRIGLGPSEPTPDDALDEAARRAGRRRWTDQRRKDFDRGRDHLISARKLREEDGMIWPLDG